MFRFISKISEFPSKRYVAFSVWLIVSLWQPARFSMVERNTGICFKMRANYSMPVVTTKYDTFIEMIEATRAFADKSLVIREILALKEPIVLITLPRKWGKTMNLEMMKLFFEIEVDKRGNQIEQNMTTGYKFFINGEITPKGEKTSKLRHPPKISTEETICKKYLSKYPVIYIDMYFAFSPPTFQETVNHVRMLIGETFDKHEYMIKVFQKIINNGNNSIEVKAKAQKDLIIFEKFLHRAEESIPILLKSFKFLCRVLYQYFNKKVIILVDDYDYALVDMFAWVFEPFFYDRLENVEEDVLRLFAQIMKYTFNNNQFLEKAILTGQQQICNERLFANFTTEIAKFDYFGRGLADYYGFTKPEIDVIFTKDETDVSLKNRAINWYWGYRVDKDTPMYVYNPWDIVSFVEEDVVGNFWLEVGNKYWFTHVLKFQSMYEIFKTLYFGFKQLYVDFEDVQLSRDDLVTLGNVIFEAFGHRDHPMTPHEIQLLLKYLCSVGYLTSNGYIYDASLGRNALRVKIPNEELRTQYQNFTFELKPPFTWDDATQEPITVPVA